MLLNVNAVVLCENHHKRVAQFELARMKKMKE